VCLMRPLDEGRRRSMSQPRQIFCELAARGVAVADKVRGDLGARERAVSMMAVHSQRLREGISPRAAEAITLTWAT